MSETACPEGLESPTLRSEVWGHGTHVTADGLPLGQWVQTQRKAYHKGHLPQERIDCLEALPDWVWNVRAPKT